MTIPVFRDHLTDEPIPQGMWRRVDFQITDGLGARIPAANIDTLTLTLYDEDTGGIINTRDGQDVLNVNGGTYVGDETTAVGTFVLGATDNAMENPTRPHEVHVLLFEFSWDGDAEKTGAHEVRVLIENLAKLP